MAEPNSKPILPSSMPANQPESPRDPSAAAEHRKQATSRLSGIGQKLLNDIEFDENEELICEIHKHPFGLFLIYLIGMFVTVVLLAITLLSGVYLESSVAGDGLNLASFRAVFIGLGFLLTILSVVVTAISIFLYRNNVLLVTSEKISQLLYHSIFDRKISQLSIGDVQDVTVKQTGIPAHLFNYGTLVIETAGEQQNYTFTYAPFPYQCSKDIVGAHERNLQKFGN